MRAVVALLTDFGLADPYVAQMKGALLTRCPEAAIVDVSHEVPPFGLPSAALFLAASRAHFPAGTVFACVVDPGVGGSRRIVGLEKDRQVVLAPDNGLLGPVLAAPGPARAFDLSAHAQAPGVSATFHGRDVFAPLAAALGCGQTMAALGPEIPLDGLERLPWAEPRRRGDGRGVEAAVLHVDRFGNAVTNLGAAMRTELAAWGPLALEVGGAAPLPVAPARTYAELPAGALGLITGSQGYLELAMYRAGAAEAAGLAPGDAFTLAAAGEDAP